MNTQNLQPTCVPVPGGIFVSLAGHTYFISNETIPLLDTLSFSPTPSFLSPPSEPIVTTGVSSISTPTSITGQETQSIESTVNGFAYPPSQNFLVNNVDTSSHASLSPPGMTSQGYLRSTVSCPMSNSLSTFDRYSGPDLDLDSQLIFDDPSAATYSAALNPISDFSRFDDNAHGPPNVAKCRPRSDKGKSKQPNNNHGRKGTLRCTPCRKNHKRCVFTEGEPCGRCVEKGMVGQCVKQWGPMTEKKKGTAQEAL